MNSKICLIVLVCLVSLSVCGSTPLSVSEMKQIKGNAGTTGFKCGPATFLCGSGSRRQCNKYEVHEGWMCVTGSTGFTRYIFIQCDAGTFANCDYTSPEEDCMAVWDCEDKYLNGIWYCNGANYVYFTHGTCKAYD